MEDGLERSLSFLIAELEQKQRIVTMPKYEEQVHPLGLSLIGRETMPISHKTTPIGCAQTLVKTTPNLQSTNTGSDS